MVVALVEEFNTRLKMRNCLKLIFAIARPVKLGQAVFISMSKQIPLSRWKQKTHRLSKHGSLLTFANVPHAPPADLRCIVAYCSKKVP